MRALAVDLVIVGEVFGGVFEAQAPNLGRERYSLRYVPFALFQKVARVVLDCRARAFLLAVPFT